MILTGLACQLLLGRWGVRSRPVFLFSHGDLRRSLAGPSYPAAPLSLAPKIPLLFTLIPDKPGFQPPLNHVRKTLLQALKDAIREESYARELPLLTSFLQSRPLPPPSVADCSLPAKLLASERRWVTLSLYYQLCLSYPSPDPTPHAETLSRWDLSSLPGRDAVLQELLAASLTSTPSDPVPLELLQLLDFSLTGTLQQVDDVSIQSQSPSPSTAAATTTTAISSSLQNILRLAAIIAHYGDPARASALWCLVLARGHKQPLLQSLQHPALLEIFCSHILPDAVDQGVNKTLSPLLQALVHQWSDQPAVLAKLAVGIVSALAGHAAVRDGFLEALRSHLGSLSPQEEAAHAFLRHLSEFQPDGPLRTELLLLLLGPTSRQKQGMLLSASLPTDSLLFLFHLSLGEVSISSLPTSEMVCNLSANILRSPDHFPAFISTMMALGRHWTHSNSSLPVLSLLCAKVFDSPSHQPS
ncbi:MAG: hypothetical protein Q8P67_25005, partial [archaeon]|nr:hypothetical protein [archaeon]